MSSPKPARSSANGWRSKTSPPARQSRPPPPADQVIGNLAAGLEQQDGVIEMTETAREFGVTLTTAETVLARMSGVRINGHFA